MTLSFRLLIAIDVCMVMCVIVSVILSVAVVVSILMLVLMFILGFGTTSWANIGSNELVCKIALIIINRRKSDLDPPHASNLSSHTLSYGILNGT